MKVINRKLCCAAAALLLLDGTVPLTAAARKGQGKFSPLAYSMRPVRKTPSASARTAFARFAAKQGKNWEVRYNPRTALPEAITGGRTKRYTGGPEQAAAAFFSENSELLKIDPTALRLELKKENLGVTHLQYQQYYRDLPVEFSYARAHITGSGEVAGYQARFEPGIDLDIVPAVTAEQAVLTAASDLGAQLNIRETELVIFPDEEAGALKLAWKIRGRTPGGLWVYYIDAKAGGVLLKYDDTRRYCGGDPYLTMGSSSGTVYEISPFPSQNSDGVTINAWTKPKPLALSDQYFWVRNNTIPPVVTDQLGDFCSGTAGKVFSALKGPFFNVANSRGMSAHFDNASGVWRSYQHPALTQTPGLIANSTSYSYDITVVPALTGEEVMAKVMPRFDTFRVGSMDEYGSVNDADEVDVKYGTTTVGSYIGQRTRPFYGASVERPSYTLALKTDETGTSEGFTVRESSYLVLVDFPSVSGNTPGNPAGSSVLWSTTAASSPGVYIDDSLGQAQPARLDEVNAFYHLNKVRNYFQKFNKTQAGGVAPADLDKQIPVMVHASGAPDNTPYTGMLNAFYDSEYDNIFFGDGPWDGNYHRSFALDGTIVRHEYTHLAVHRIYPIINFGEFGAISEALSDYFSLASFWKEGYDENNTEKKNLDTLGNFLGTLNYSRKISGTDKIMPGSWRGELYNDSLILSQTLYTLRAGANNASANNLGYIGGTGVFKNLPMSDFLVWAALFYFPDSFLNFRDAMIDACAQFDVMPLSGGCSTALRTKIVTAFNAHGIPGQTGDRYDTQVPGTLCGNNNGPECSTDISTMSALSATIFPAGDLDYYTLPVAAGEFSATLALPETTTPGFYKAYALYLFNAKREFLAEAVPDMETDTLRCPGTGDCITYFPSVTLNYSVPAAGRYYLLVAGGPTPDAGNGGVNSASLAYTLYNSANSARTRGEVRAYLDASSKFDDDLISFEAHYSSFSAFTAPVSTLAALGGGELYFEYAQLRDHNNLNIANARTNQAGACLTAGTACLLTEGAIIQHIDLDGLPYFSGSVRVQKGFAARYPGVGTVALEVFGRNRLGAVVSLGVSDRFYLTTNKTDFKTYNNILGASNSEATIKCDLQSAGNLSIKIYTQTGTLVKTIYDGPAGPGKPTFVWNGTNDSGGKAASGIYFLKAKGPGLNKMEKIAIVR